MIAEFVGAAIGGDRADIGLRNAGLANADQALGALAIDKAFRRRTLRQGRRAQEGEADEKKEEGCEVWFHGERLGKAGTGVKEREREPR